MRKTALAHRFLRRYGDKLAKIRRWEQFSTVILHQTSELMDFGENREVFYRHINERHLQNGSINYLEFGVWKGESINAWAQINASPESRFYGFDSFQGLPELWTKDRPKGHFSIGGRLPDAVDSRVMFIAGWFNQTLNGFLHGFVNDKRLVAHLDADLYSSTLYVLMNLDRVLRPGSVLIFDEFSDLNHEFAAFWDFAHSCGREFKVLCGRRDFGKIAIEIL